MLCVVTVTSTYSSFTDVFLWPVTWSIVIIINGKYSLFQILVIWCLRQFPVQFPWCTSWAVPQTPSLYHGLSRTGPTETSWSTSSDTMTRYTHLCTVTHIHAHTSQMDTWDWSHQNVFLLFISGFRCGQCSECVQRDQHSDRKLSDSWLHLRLPDQSSKRAWIWPLQQHHLLHHTTSWYEIYLKPVICSIVFNTQCEWICDI